MDRKEALSELANQVLMQTDIVQVIGERITINRRGKNHLACCPFHQEKTPSFNIMQKEQFYYCFGCKASGNAIHFLREYDRMSFFEALEYLARQAGIELPALNQRANQVDADELTLLNDVTQFFQQNLRECDEAINYLKDRGITGQTAKTFRLGYAVEAWDKLLKTFNTSQDKLEMLHRHGLIITKDSGKRYDRFRHRIIYPIIDVRGQPIAYGARTIKDDTPKYLNSPQTPLFHKSDALYGIHEMLTHCRKPDFILVVEGYMDVIALHQAGIPETVATLGTASNRGQLRMLQRYTDRVIYCFDGDNAGRKAAWHALTEALTISHDRMDLRFLFLPEGEDPDSYVGKFGADKMREFIETAQPLSEAFFEHITNEHDTSSLDGKARCAQDGVRSIHTMPAGLLRDMLTSELGKRLDIDLSSIETVLDAQPTPAVPRTEHTISASNAALPATPTSKVPNHSRPAISVAPIKHALTLLLKAPELALKTKDFANLSELAHELVSPPKELKLLIGIHQKLSQSPELTTGQVVNLYEQPAIQSYLLSLSAEPIAIDPSLYDNDYSETIERSRFWCVGQLLETLIQTSKTRPLAAKEKERLHYLLQFQSKSRI